LIPVIFPVRVENRVPTVAGQGVGGAGSQMRDAMGGENGMDVLADNHGCAKEECVDIVRQDGVNFPDTVQVR
jgi:hypothetical protein